MLNQFIMMVNIGVILKYFKKCQYKVLEITDNKKKELHIKILTYYFLANLYKTLYLLYFWLM